MPARGARSALYFMYDVKQANPRGVVLAAVGSAARRHAELGKVVMGRGAVNQKGPQSAFLAALHAIRAAGRKMPVNLVLVAEGEEEIGSPHFPQVVLASPVREALAKCEGIFMPEAAQDLDGNVHDLARRQGHRRAASWSRAARSGGAVRRRTCTRAIARALDSPAWHLVQALNTLVDAERRSGDRRLTWKACVR